jgi:hypothetical protein
MKNMTVILFAMILLFTAGCGFFYNDKEYYNRESRDGTGDRHGDRAPSDKGKMHDNAGTDGKNYSGDKTGDAGDAISSGGQDNGR